MANDLLTSILEGGIRSPNFFNGRLLSGEDLNLEKAANRDARRQLGRALGDGVAFGLDVNESADLSSVDQPIVTIMPGLAVNRRGQTLMLTTKIDISLVRSLESEGGNGQTFDDCKPPSPTVYVAGAGVYLLVVCPATGKEGRAPVSGLGNVPASCNSRYTVECLQFRLIKLDVGDDDLADSDHLRNRLAYKCFGLNDDNYADYVNKPFSEHESGYGLLDDLRPKILTNCDVPLALLYWTSTDGIVFIDAWSVRRGITPPGSEDEWLPLTGARRKREGEAMFNQFQVQIETIRQKEAPIGLIEAKSRFDYLPATGIIPFSMPKTSRTFDMNFFKGLTVRDPVFINGAKLQSLICKSFSYPPIDLGSEEMIWLYRVRENGEAINDGKLALSNGYLVFSTGHIHYQGAAQFDLSYWDYSNYAG